MSSPHPIFERTLPNGLQVILRESHDAPLASFWVWYRVGSRNEGPGLTGVSHWVEHMQFKGTPTIPKGAIFRDVSKNGGTLNALTSNDWTAYFETLPSDRLDLSLAIESDRMTSSLFDPEETESERTVILSELQGAENSPTYLLYKEVVGTAFRHHPYRHMVIGDESDLRAITRDDLFGHYRRNYIPTNAVVVAAGDFDAEQLFGRIQRSFGAIELGSEAAPILVAEPPQLGERRVTLRRPAPTAYLRVAFHTPPARHAHTPAILIADAILSGGKPMGLGGGGPMGRSARLYRALVASGLARAARSDFDLYVDPYLLVVGVTALPGIDPDRIERAVDDALTQLASEPVPGEELARALKQLKAQYVYSSEGVTNQAFWLGQMEIVDSYRRADTLVDELERVTAEDVCRVAATYLTPTTRTVGWLLPEGAGGGADGEAVETAAVVPVRRWGIGGAGAPPIPRPAPRPPFERTELGNGIVVLGQAQPGDPAVSLRLRLQAGAAADPPDRPGLAAFTARTLSRGTPSMTFEAFNETTDRLGATVSVDASRVFTEVAVRCLCEDLPALLALTADVLRNPVFPAEEVEKVRNEMLTALKEQDDDTRATADRMLRQLLYPAGHPFRHRVLGEGDSVTAVTREELLAFHRRQYGPKVMTVAIVGGIAGFPQAIDQIATRFGDWNTEATAAPTPGVPARPTQFRQAATAIAGKSQADLAIGYLTVPRSHPSYDALQTTDLILGRLGLMGRLGANVRDRQGLAYYVYSAIDAGREASIWTSRAGVDPSNVERALTSVIDEVRRLREEPVMAEELADAKSYLTGSLPLALESNDGVASTLLNIEYHDLGLDFLDRFPSIVNALTREQLLAAAHEHLDPDRFAVGIAGPPSGTPAKLP